MLALLTADKTNNMNASYLSLQKQNSMIKQAKTKAPVVAINVIISIAAVSFVISNPTKIQFIKIIHNL